MMTTQEVANKLADYMRRGEIFEAQADLYADDIVCMEPEGGMAPALTKGKEAVIRKGKQFAEMIEEKFSGSCSDPIVAGEFFSLSMTLDVAMKGMGRILLEEICVYQVKNGKIVFEQFFFTGGE